MTPNIPLIAELCDAYDSWLHIDAGEYYDGVVFLHRNDQMDWESSLRWIWCFVGRNGISE